MIKKILKRISLSFFLLYCFNSIGVNFNLIIPINIITLLIIFISDVPGLAILTLLRLLVF